MTNKPKPPPRNFDYRCTSCGRRAGREALVAKRVEFATVGKPFKRLKTRTVAWLCSVCLSGDPAWQQESTRGAPGLADVRAQGREVVADAAVEAQVAQ